MHTYVNRGVCARVLGKDLEDSETLLQGRGGGKSANSLANYFSLEKANSRFPDICNLKVLFQVYFDQIPRINSFHKRKAIAPNELS